MTELFAPQQPAHAGNSPFELRDFQAEDCDAVMKAWAEGKRGVVMCWATGLGKSVGLAELSRRVTTGRVLVVVDSTTLARDLVKTITKHHGRPPGILTGDLKSHWWDKRVVVATVQTLYAGKPGEERYRDFDPHEFSAMLIDECEASLADQYAATILHFFDGNPDLRIAGCSATPFRTDGRTMGALYEHCNREIGTLNRNLKWGVLNGWLVKPKQAFVTCDIDFSSLKIRKTKDGETDWSDRDIAQLLLDQDEQEMRRMAESIHHVAGDKQTIIVCPNDVQVARVIAGHLCGASGDDDAAQAIYGEQGEYAKDLIKAHKRQEFQHAVSVNMLIKGYDNDQVVYAFMLRKTRSRRMYEQVMGRTTRPLEPIRAQLAEAESAEERIGIIEASAKPWACMVDLVGVHPDAKDMGVIDIIGDYLPEDLRRRTIEMMHDKMREPGADEDELPEEQDVGQTARDALADLREQKRLEEEREREERRRRSLVQVTKRNVNVEYTDDFGKQGNGQRMAQPARGTATQKQVQLLVAFGVKPDTALSYSKRKAGAVIKSYKDRNAPVNWRNVRQWERGQAAAV